MLAIIEIGKIQYKISENSEIYVEKVTGKPHDLIKIDKVLMIDKKIGHPYLKNSYVECEILKHGKKEKITVIHHISQKHHTRKYGHRQAYTKLLVKKINLND